MTPAGLRALIDAASKAGAGTWSIYYAAASPDVVSALARIALAAVGHVTADDDGYGASMIGLEDALRDAGLLGMMGGAE